MAIFTYWDGADPTGTITGNAADDTVEVKTNHNNSPTQDFLTFDLRNLQASSIEQIRFSPHYVSGHTDTHDLTVELAASQISANGFSSSLKLIGFDQGGFRETVNIYMGAATALDLTGWIFQSWGGQGEKIRIFGDADAETINGSSARDHVTGGAGNDVLFGHAGDDMLMGDAGNDELHGGEGDDTLYGGDGDDILYGEAGLNKQYGGNGNDTFVYVNGKDVSQGAVLDGGAGTDRLQLKYSSGILKYFDMKNMDFASIEEIQFVTTTSATTYLALTADQLVAGGGISPNAVIIGTDAAGRTEKINVLMDLETKLDLSGWTFVDWGGQGEEVRIKGDYQQETIDGTSMADVIDGRGGNDVLRGGGGDDRIYGGKGDDQIDGGAGSDRLKGNFGNDELRGGDATDWLWGGGSDDVMYGDAGNDRLYGQNGADQLWGGAGNDRLKGHGGDDRLEGGAGIDLLVGGAGDDQLYGREDNDWLLGGDGNDVLGGGTGNDKMWGGTGADYFFYGPADGTDIIKDFEDDIDKIDLTMWGFGSAQDALLLAVQVGAHVKFDFSPLPSAGADDKLWVLNATLTQLENDIII